MPTAIVDIGTNSTRLLIGEAADGQSDLKVLSTGLITTRLGEGIGASKILTEAAIERTITALLEFKRAVDANGAGKVAAVATSAVRDAQNRDEFLLRVRCEVGWNVRVLSGEEEAAMSYLGVVRGLRVALRNPVVVDIGGGSTEFIWNSGDNLKCMSLRLGAVRMTEQNSSLEDIGRQLTRVIGDIKAHGMPELIGVGGTLTTLAAIDQGLTTYDPEKVHGYYITCHKIKEILVKLERMSLDERKSVPGLQPQRADIIVAGVRIVSAILDGVESPGITVSESDIMHGVFYSALQNSNFDGN